MQITFYKYQGTGNDFILIDNRNNSVSLTQEQVLQLCNRRFGIGADGLILLENATGFDFNMVYYNSDGNKSTMCGNGGRCITAFAKHLGIITDKANFLAADGAHEALIDDNETVSLKMNDVKTIEMGEDYFFLNTGSPHYVKQVQNLQQYNVFAEGKKIRNSERFKEEGTNVNFIEKNDDDTLFVRTYERGVEDETFSCGTGVTASALVAAVLGFSTEKNKCSIKTLGGNLEVSFDKVLEHNFYNVWLKGSATLVYRGTVEL
ncbi:MAG: diaminopimelate epimerase [Bacteroidetes bacterium]|nr:diaminopimelate epimerase [Bacteroidota bacterium]